MKKREESVKMRVWHIPQIPGKAFKVNVKDEVEARKIIDILSMYDQFQFQERIKGDFSNICGVEVFNNKSKEWEDYENNTENKDGISFDDYCEGNNVDFCKELMTDNNIKF
jgi:hypothetical protein